MMGINNHYIDIRREIKNQLIRYCLVRAATSPLVLLWLFGSVLFLIWVPLLAVLWTLVSFIAALGMCIQAVQTKQARASAVRVVVRGLLPVSEAGDSARAQIARVRDLLEEVVTIIAHARWSRGADLYVARTLSNLCDLTQIYRDRAGESTYSTPAGTGVRESVLQALTNTSRVVRERISLLGPTSATVAIDLARYTGQSVSAILARLEPALAPLLPVLAGGQVDGGPGGQTAEAVPYDLQEVARGLKARFSRLRFDEGLQALERLDHQYIRLVSVLDRKKESDPTAVIRIPQLAEEAYRQGLSVLRDVEDLAEDVRSVEIERIEAEIAGLEGEVTALAATDGNEQRVQIKEATLKDKRERLAIMYDHELRIEELLHQCERCEGSLDRVRMELSVLRGESSTESITMVTEGLRQTVEQARSVQNELKRAGL
jgi:hypothetical protein